MIKQKNIFLFLIIVFILINLVTAKHLPGKKIFKKINTTRHEINILTESSPQENQKSSIKYRDNLYSYDFESDSNGWTFDSGWILSDENYNSATHSMNSFQQNSGEMQMWQLISPIISIEQTSLNEIMYYKFNLLCDMPDFTEEDDPEYLADYWILSIMDTDPISQWHTSNYNSTDGSSWWCADEGIDGYRDSWVQYLDSPTFNVPESASLSADMRWGIEDFTDVSDVGGECLNGGAIDGWDQANVQISNDGGLSFIVLDGSDPYDFDCGFGTVYNGILGLPGWGGNQDWHNVNFDLSAYAGEDVIIRFAFYSDVAYSTIDDFTIDGFQVDNIILSGGSFNDSGDDDETMNTSGAIWVDQFYDYGDLTQPGVLGWTEYSPGTAFDGNIFQELTEFEGKDIRFRFQAIFDGDNDIFDEYGDFMESTSDSGAGLFIDDFIIFSESTEIYPSPTELNIEIEGDNVRLIWSDLLNYDGSFVHILDSGENASFANDVLVPCGGCETFIGNVFSIHGNSYVDSVYIYNMNDSQETIDIAAFTTYGQLFDAEPLHTQSVTLTQPGMWNGFSVDWELTGPFIIAQTITDEISYTYDSEGLYHYGVFFDGANWQSITQQTAGIRANITKESSDVIYNIYRYDVNGNYDILSSTADVTYVDNEAVAFQTYAYGISATYPPDNEESNILFYPEPISILPNSYHELQWDDGTFGNEFFDFEEIDELAIKFHASNLGEQIVRIKWYQLDIGSAFYLNVWENDNNTPGTLIHDKLISSSGSAGWQEYDLSDENWPVTGTFWIGIKKISDNTPLSPIAVDYNQGSNNWMFKNSNSNWEPYDDWNIVFRVFLDCTSEIFDDCGVCDGDNSTCTDCTGEVNGTAIEDNCGVCGGNNSPNTGTCDCLGIPGGNAQPDTCGICNGPGQTNECGCDDIIPGFCDCIGTPPDECGICNGDNSSCADNCGTPNGDDSNCTGCMDPDSPLYDIDATIPCINNCCYTLPIDEDVIGCMNPFSPEYDEDATIPCTDNCCFYNPLINNENIIPTKFEIINLYPNPFNPQINIEYNLPATSKVNVSIFNLKGEKIDKLVDSIQHTGLHSLTWYASGQNSGIYFIQITADDDIINRKIMYIK